VNRDFIAIRQKVNRRTRKQALKVHQTFTRPWGNAFSDCVKIYAFEVALYPEVDF